jgi:hypothetical protein
MNWMRRWELQKRDKEKPMEELLFWFGVEPSVADHQPKDSHGFEQVRIVFSPLSESLADERGTVPTRSSGSLLRVDWPWK